jgi:ketosteroid isomerase-like protein
MKVIARLALFALTTGLGCAPPSAELSPADVAAIQHRFDEVASHVTKREYAAWASDFTPDGVFMIGNAPASRGRAAIQKFGEAGPKAISLTFSDVQIHGSGSLAWATSAYTFKAEGAPMDDTGKQLIVFQRQPDGSWLTLAASASSDLPPPPPPLPAKK